MRGTLGGVFWMCLVADCAVRAVRRQELDHVSMLHHRLRLQLPKESLLFWPSILTALHIPPRFTLATSERIGLRGGALNGIRIVL